jgi:hypothetical protein
MNIKIVTTICVFVLMIGCVFTASAGTITDNFNDGKIDDWKVFSGAWSAKDGVIHQTEMGGPKVIVWNTPGDLKEFTITVKAMGLSADADWGVAFRATDVNNHYSWQYCNSALEFVSYVGGTRAETNLQGQGAVVNKWQEFKVVSKGTSYDLYWEGNMIKNFENKSLTTGLVGLFVWDLVDFDDFTVTADSIKGLAVSPSGNLAAAWGSIKAE